MTDKNAAGGGVSQWISVPIDVWTRLVFAAKDTDDGRFRTLMEQAVMEAKTL